ncbi:hypothetical protein [Polyangium sorediatum]|uniref:Lipoprotein n=1 Tax=Polyangium sorediatum TaxID=889274 RepID=A0ABT6P5K6_9BACT|nr:hypothetical protein [Polyangium sorediatum]MDI1435587.1 hypothetical protein [Polyangium sorediatum]
MKPVRMMVCSASLVALVAACVAEPVDDMGEEQAAESSDAIKFQAGDPDITWSGPATYSAPWANSSFDPYPGMYIFQSGSLVRGTVYLSASTVCHFSSYNETSTHITFQTAFCSGPRAGLRVNLTCLKQANLNLQCTGVLASSGGNSNVSAVFAREIVCAPDGCYDGPYPPVPAPDPDCGGGNPCGGTQCCLPGERCGDGKCWVPTDEVSSR